MNLSFALYPKKFLSDESFPAFWNIFTILSSNIVFSTIFSIFLCWNPYSSLTAAFQFIFHDMCILLCVHVFIFLLVSDMFWGSSSVLSTSLLFLLLLYTHFIVDFMLSKDFSKYFSRFLICSFGIFYVSFFYFSLYYNLIFLMKTVLFIFLNLSNILISKYTRFFQKFSYFSLISFLAFLNIKILHIFWNLDL